MQRDYGLGFVIKPSYDIRKNLAKGEGEKMNSEFTKEMPHQNNTLAVEMSKKRGRPVTVDRSYASDRFC